MKLLVSFTCLGLLFAAATLAGVPVWLQQPASPATTAASQTVNTADKGCAKQEGLLAKIQRLTEEVERLKKRITQLKAEQPGDLFQTRLMKAEQRVESLQ